MNCQLESGPETRTDRQSPTGEGIVASEAPGVGVKRLQGRGRKGIVEDTAEWLEFLQHLQRDGG